MTNIVRYNESGGRGPSTKLWTMGCPPNGELFTNIERGVGFFDDFLWAQPSADWYTNDNTDSGTYAPLISVMGGVLNMAVSGTDNNENELQFGQAATQSMKINAGTGRCFFEARLKFSSVTNDVLTMALGIAEEACAAGDFLTDGGAVNAIGNKDFVGFGVWADDGDSVDTFYKTSGATAVTVQAGVATLVADTYVKLGFSYDGVGKLTYFVDGVACATTTATETATDFPDGEEMNMILAIKTSSAAALAAYVDWWAWAQEIV